MKKETIWQILEVKQISCDLLFSASGPYKTRKVMKRLENSLDYYSIVIVMVISEAMSMIMLCSLY